jgi:hypothetical protein
MLCPDVKRGRTQTAPPLPRPPARDSHTPLARTHSKMAREYPKLSFLWTSEPDHARSDIEWMRAMLFTSRGLHSSYKEASVLGGGVLSQTDAAPLPVLPARYKSAGADSARDGSEMEGSSKMSYTSQLLGLGQKP